MLPRLRTSHLIATIAALCAACAKDSQQVSARAPEPAAAGQGARPPTLVTPGRLLAFPDSPGSQLAVDAEGSRRAILHGLRLLERGDGTIERGEQLLPSRKSARSLELPKRLGGGFLFYVEESGSTALWRASTWTGKLEPFANLEAEVAQVVAGFDRLYLIEKRGDVIALDAESGEARDKGSLPPSPGYASMAFADPWFGAVDVPMRGVLATFDAGSSWHPAGVNAQSVLLDAGELVVRSPEGDQVLDRAGHLRQRGAATPGDSAFQPAPGAETQEGESEQARVLPPGPLGRRPLRLAALHGWPDSPTTAIVAHDGTLGRVRLRDGKVLEFAEQSYPEGGSCHALPVLDGFGFVCGQERGKTTVYAFEPPLALRPLITFPEPRYVASSGNGALVIRGGCPDAGERAEPGAYCIVDAAGRVRPLIVNGDLGVERVTALRDGRTAVLVPPRHGAPGLLTLVDAAGGANTVKLELPRSDSSVAALLKKGLWLDGFVETKPGVLAGWVVASGPFVGVRIDQDGKVVAGKVAHDIDRALLAGPFAFVFSRAGLAKETSDGGFRFRDLELPVDLDALSRKGASSDSRAERGCSPVGCAFGEWLRIGWSSAGELQELDTAEPPPPTARLSPGGSRWVLSCSPTGESSPASKSVVEPAATRRSRFATAPPASSAGGEELENATFRWFLELAPPSRRATEAGFDHGTETEALQLRAYVWGARGAPWGRVGRWQARVADRFSVLRGAWSTQASRSPWDDLTTAAQTFGADPNSSTPTNWRAALEATGRAAALLVTARSATELYLLEEERSIVPVQDAGKWAPFGDPLSVVKLDNAWFLGAPSGNQTFRLFKIEGDRIELLREYPLRLAAGGPVSVVRTSRGSGLGIAVRSAGLFVYPVDPKTGETGEVLEVAPPALAQLPTECDTEQDGWLVTGNFGISPYVELAGGAEAVRVRELEARLIVSTVGVCTDGLAAKSEAPITLAPARKATQALRSAGVPLIISDRSPNGRRWGFRCHK